MELWDLYNENRELVGSDHLRGDQIPEGCFHLVVHVWIRNSNGAFLISQRSASRPTFPLMWECVGGSVLKGEDSLTGALREVHEEIGLTLSADAGNLISSTVRKVVNNKNFSDILDIWLFEYDGPFSLEKATTNEVAQVKWMTPDQIMDLHDSGQMVHTLSYFSSLICAL